jgi:hypothetical protein
MGKGHKRFVSRFANRRPMQSPEQLFHAPQGQFTAQS